MMREGTREPSHGKEPPVAALLEYVMIGRVAPRPPPKPKGGEASAQTVVERSPPGTSLANGSI